MLIKIFLGAGALSASFWMYSISWQYGLGTLVLLLSLLSIASLIRKASTTVMVNKPLQKDQSSAGITDEEVIKQTSPPLPVMPGGIDSNVFERFRESIKLAEVQTSACLDLINPPIHLAQIQSGLRPNPWNRLPS